MSLTPSGDPKPTPQQPAAEPMQLRTIDPESVDFHPTLRVVNRTRRFSLPIPDLGEAAEPLVYPLSSDRAGEAIKAHEDGTPERGVVFYNQTDGIWQGVRANGEGVLVLNDIDPHTASCLMEKIQDAKSNVDELTLDDIIEVLRYAQLELGITDIYNSKRSAIENGTVPHEDMPVPEGVDGQPRNDFGYRVVNKDVVHRVALETEGFVFGDKRAQRYSEGAVIMTDEKYRWCVDSKVFQRNFKKLVNGQELPLESLDKEFGNAE